MEVFVAIQLAFNVHFFKYVANLCTAHIYYYFFEEKIVDSLAFTFGSIKKIEFFSCCSTCLRCLTLLVLITMALLICHAHRAKHQGSRAAILSLLYMQIFL